MPLHNCKGTKKWGTLIWKVFNHWRYIPINQENKITLIQTPSNGVRIDKCPYCRKVLV